MKRRNRMLVLLLITGVTMLALSACTAEPDPAPTKAGTAAGLQYPQVDADKAILERPKASQTIYVVKSTVKGLDGKKGMTAGEKLLLQSVQGIVAQRNAEIYIGQASDEFLVHARKQYQLTVDDGEFVYTVDAEGKEQQTGSASNWLKDLGSIVNHYTETGDIKGYVKIRLQANKYSEQKNQSNQGCTYAGAYGYIIVAEKVEAALNEYCPMVTLGKDISGSDITQYEVYKECEALLNKNVLIMQAAPRIEHLREYGISQKAGFYFYNETDPEAERDYVYSSLNIMANAFGWEQIDKKEDGVAIGMREDPSVDFASQRNVNVFAADWCQNLSIWMSFPEQKLEQVSYKKISAKEEQVHYVSFLLSDGDNIQWTTGTGFTNDFFLQMDPAKKEMPFGWTMTPSMAEVAPSILSNLYNNMKDIEQFVGSVSGYAYSHPAHFSDEALALFARNTGVMMGKADMDLLAMKGVNEKVMNAFADQKEINGGFVMYGADSGKGGNIYWANGKPFIHDRYILWKDAGEKRDPEMIAKRINQLRDLSTDKTQSSCYSFIQVHCWSYKYEDVIRLFYNNLDHTKIKVITPGEMVDLIKENVSPAEKGYTK